MPKPQSIEASLIWATEQLADSESAKLDAKLLLCHALKCQTVYLHTWPERLLTDEQNLLFATLVDQRRIGTPIAYILGYKEFWSLRLAVSEHTLIPRPETETLVETALSLAIPPKASVLDLGTGTGAIALALASERVEWQVTGIDKQEQAVELAQRNAKTLGLEKVSFYQSDWFSAVDQTKFDLIVSNPPYVESDSHYLGEGDVRFEPDSALTSGKDGLDDIRIIIDRSRDFLADSGWLVLEHGYNQSGAIQLIFESAGFSNVQTIADLNQLPRVTLACIAAAS